MIKKWKFNNSHVIIIFLYTYYHGEFEYNIILFIGG